jgi:hypothetical protein
MSKELEKTEVVMEADGNAANMATIEAKPTSVSRADLMAKMVAYAASLDKDSLAQAVETITKSPDEIYDGNKAAMSGADTEGKNKAGINSSSAPKEMMHAVKEDLDAVFSVEDLSEEFRDKATTIFEAAISARVNMEVARLEDEYASKLTEATTALEAETAEALEATKTEIAEQVDSYLNYAVAEWISENRLAVEQNIRTEITESFFAGLKSLFDDHYIDIPEDKVEVVEGLADKVSELEAKLNETTDENVKLNRALGELQVKSISDALSEDLTDTQKDRFKSLVESIDYSSADNFRKKASVIKETYFNKKADVKVVEDQLLSEAVEEPAKAPQVEPEMAVYLTALSKMARK